MTDHVLATFTQRRDALAATERLEREFPGTEIRVGDRDDALDAMALGQRSEMDETFSAVSAGIVSGPLARGALLWGLAGLVVGALVAVPLSLVVDVGDMPRWYLPLFMALAGGFAASTAMFVLGAARQAVKEGETTPEDPASVVRVDASPEQADDLIRVLVEAGARQARFVDAPVSRPATGDVEAPRPLREDVAAEAGEGSDQNAGFQPDVR